MTWISRHDALRALAEFDAHGGASLALLAWEYCIDIDSIAGVWEELIASGLIQPVDPPAVDAETLYRLTPSGWGAAPRIP